VRVGPDNPTGSDATTIADEMRKEAGPMKTIHKCSLSFPGPTTLSVPAEYNIVHVDIDSKEQDTIAIWLEYDDKAATTHYPKFCIYGTGHSIPDDFIHVGSVRHPLPSGISMWHVYRHD
jgi:hypothetical protein